MNRTCADCGIDFSQKRSKKGKVNQCDECSEADETVRYVGYNDGQLNKMSNTAIYRGNNPETLKHLLKKQQGVR